MRQNSEDYRPVSSSSLRALIIIGVALGFALALMLIPTMVPGLIDSLVGPSPKAYWYLARVSGLVAYTLLWVSTALGFLITSKASRIWPGGPNAIDMHNFTGFLGLSLAIFHVLVLLGDRYMSYTLFTLLVPFASSEYHPIWVGLGQIGLYLGWIVALSFYARKRIGHRKWRILHYSSFAVYLLVTVHGVMAGTDTTTLPGVVIYLVTSGITFFLLVYRILAAVKPLNHSSGEVQIERKTTGNPAGGG